MDMEQPNDDYCVGIDLGTTNTVCAVWERGRELETVSLTGPSRLEWP